MCVIIPSERTKWKAVRPPGSVVTAPPAAPNLNLNVVPGRHLNADFILLVIRDLWQQRWPSGDIFNETRWIFQILSFRNYVASDWNIFSLFIDVFDWGSTQPVIGWAPWAFDSFAAWCERNRRLSCSRSPLLLTDLPQLRKSSASLFPPADADSCDLFRKEGGILKKIIDHVMTTFLTLLNLTFKFNYWLF